MNKGLAVLLGLYASTAAILLAIHFRTPLNPPAAMLALLGLHAVTVIAYLASGDGAPRLALRLIALPFAALTSIALLITTLATFVLIAPLLLVLLFLITLAALAQA
ncbi:MAG: hypothetical protein N3H31_05640 [Candidatus Nezhaarchaeota archaeon]|nr:hypothetical protein [Candidatus Nezhaarchaeota archaeon]